MPGREVTAGSTISPSSSLRARAYAALRSSLSRRVRRQAQQVLCALEAFLCLGGEVAPPSAGRLGFGHVECGDVLVHCVAVLQLRAAVVEDVVDTVRAQQVRVATRLVEGVVNGSRISVINGKSNSLATSISYSSQRASVLSWRARTFVISRRLAASLVRARPDASASATLVCCLMR